MKNVSLYIAKRYNANTLFISTLLIVISSLLIATLIYIGSTTVQLLQQILFPGQELYMIENMSIYLITFFYIVLQSFVLFWFYNRLLRTISKRFKIGLSLVVFLLSLLSAFFLGNQNFQSFLLKNILMLLLISTGMLSFIFGSLYAILENRKITGVNVLTSIAVLAITIATCALFIILSVFSGLEKMNTELLINVNPDLQITPVKGKVLPHVDELTKKIAQNSSVESYSKVIEEKVIIEFDDKQDIAYLKGIDKNYTKVVRIDTMMYTTNGFLDFSTPYQLISSDGVARRLQLYTGKTNPARLRMPKPGTGLINSENEAFNSAMADPLGVFFINEQYDKYVISPIGLPQALLQLPENSAYSIEIKLKKNQQADLVKSALQKELGKDVWVKTRKDMDATFIKVMNVENLITYLIFTLVTFIASFNLAGVIIIIMLDKKNQIKTIWGFGMKRSDVQRIFFQTGLLITLFSILFGIVLGSIIGILQNKFNLIMANPVVPFPFEFLVTNYLVVIATVLFIGGGVSYLVSRRLPI